MNDKVKERLGLAFRLTADLVRHLDESALVLDIPALPSNSIANQLWCVVGARESYLRAVEAGAWAGFACSLKTPSVKRSALDALDATERKLADIDVTSLDSVKLDLLFVLLEHEVMHHGQLIRYVYANELGFPSSWHERYTV